MRIKLPLSFLNNRRICEWKFDSLCSCVQILTFCLGVCAGVYMFHWHNEIPIVGENNQNKHLECYKRSQIYILLARQLESIFDLLKESSVAGFHLQLLRQAIHLLDPQKRVAVKTPNYQQKPREVCGEVYIGPKDGPIYRTGFVPDPKCDSTKLPAFESLVTVLFLEQGSGNSEVSLNNSIVTLREIYPNLDVIIATDNRLHLNKVTPETKVIISNADDFNTPGRLWNKMLKHTFTRYVLVARDVARVDKLARLPRLVHVLSTIGIPLAVAGGAIRYPSGHWRAGCLQTHMRHYALRLRRDYRFSSHDCMLCDHLEGPFLVRADLLDNIPFNENLPGTVLFEDWFLRLKQRRFTVAACPDSLFFVDKERELGQDVVTREGWRMLGQIWKLDSVTLDNQETFRFKCNETDLQCDLPALRRDGLLMPSCCIDQIVNGLEDFDNFASKHNLDYEVGCGMALGAVKLRGFMPWDIDGDIYFPNTDFKVYYQKQKEFKEKGYDIRGFTKTSRSKYFSIKTPDISFDMWGLPNLSVHTLPKEVNNETRVEINGLWLRSYTNPGLAVRNRYGPGYLKHSLRISDLRINTFCAMHQHPSCLNKQPVDGSSEFLSYHQHDKQNTKTIKN